MLKSSPMQQISWIYDLYRLGLDAAGSNDVSALYQRILRHVVAGFTAQSGSFALQGKDGLVIVAGIDLPEGVVGSRVDADGGILGWVAKEGKALLLNGDMSDDPRFRLHCREHDGKFSAICWPLMEGNRNTGCISVNRPASLLPFSDEDVEQGTALLNLVSLALSNIRLHMDQKNRFEELRHLNKRLEEAQNQLLQSEKMASIGQLAAGVAHEINNPIGYVSSNLGSLQRHINDILTILAAYEEMETAFGIDAFARVHRIKQELELDYIKDDVFALLQESEEGIGRVKKIVQDLKDFSHVDEAEWQFTDMHKGLDSTLNIVHNELKYKATVVKEYGNLPEVECLPSQLNQVFMNLLVNAAHAIEETGSISVKTGVDGEYVWIEIRDTGHGIPRENLTRIFDPFFTTKPVGKGTGLGLSLSYSILQKHGGRIEVESEVGKGTAFRVTLPVRQPETKAM